MYIKPQLFEQYDAYVIMFNADYLALHGRSLFKPIIEIWNIGLTLEYMNVALNSKANPALFQTESVNTIFDRFQIASRFNKLPKRSYYRGELEIQRLNFNI